MWPWLLAAQLGLSYLSKKQQAQQPVSTGDNVNVQPIQDPYSKLLGFSKMGILGSSLLGGPSTGGGPSSVDVNAHLMASNPQTAGQFNKFIEAMSNEDFLRWLGQGR